MQLTLNIPDGCLPPRQDQTALGRQLRLYGALLMFQAGELSRGAACEFADVDVYAFLAACKAHHIPVMDAAAEEIEADLLRFERRHPA